MHPYSLVNDSELSQGRGAPGMVGMVQRRGATESSTGTSDGDVRVRFHIIRNARIENVGKISVMHGF